jgi:hypothetical protein
MVAKSLYKSRYGSSQKRHTCRSKLNQVAEREIIRLMTIARFGSAPSSRPVLALKSPAVALAESLLTEAVLKDARIVPDRRP